MTREEAIKYIKSRCIGSTEERDGTQWSEAMWTAIEALAMLPSAEPQWIPVSERLPENIGRYIVTLKDDWVIDVRVAVYGVMPRDTHNKKVFWLYDSCYDDLDITEDVVAWMHLPEPWKDGER